MHKNNKKHQQGFVIPLIIILIVVIVIVAVSSSGSKNNSSTKTTDTANTTSESKTNLANEVDTQLKKSLAVSAYSDSDTPTLFKPINGFSDTGNNNIDVNYQQDCTKDQAKSLSKQIMATVGPDVKNLDSITVKCTNGSVDFTLRGEVLTN